MELRTELFERYSQLLECEKEIDAANKLICETYKNGGTVYVCGNGGSCSDSDHIVGELMKGFLLRRELKKEETEKFAAMFEDGAEFASRLQGALPAVSLTAQTAIISAFANDVDPEMVYAQLVYGYARENDLVIGLSTSGNSKNVVCAMKAAKFRGAKMIAMTGAKESKLSVMCDVTIRVPETETFKIQELHLPVYHYLCASVEEEFFGK